MPTLIAFLKIPHRPSPPIDHLADMRKYMPSEHRAVLEKDSHIRAPGTFAPQMNEIRDVPTASESGLPGFEVVAWFGMFAPGKTPQPIVKKLNGEVVGILGMPDVREKMSGQGLIPGGNTSEELGVFLKAEIAKWSKLIKEANIRIE